MITWSSSPTKILTNKFYMEDLDVADVILEIKIIKTSSILILSQFYYIEKILNKFWQQIVKISINISLYLFKNKGERIHQLKYSQIIKSLVYVLNCTRSDIA